jgi:hypothetical protein
MQIKRWIVAAAMISLLNSCGCKKQTPKPEPPQQEPQVSFTMDVSGTIQTPGSTYVVNTTLKSAMPSAKGISIEATVTDQTNNANIPQNPVVTSTNSTNAITLINLPSQHPCNVTITISSVATPTNKASQSFVIANKS